MEGVIGMGITPVVTPEIPSCIFNQLTQVAHMGYEPNDVQRWYAIVFQNVRRPTSGKGKIIYPITPVSDGTSIVDGPRGGMLVKSDGKTQYRMTEQSTFSSFGNSLGEANWPESPTPKRAESVDNYLSEMKATGHLYAAQEQLDRRESQIAAALTDFSGPTLSPQHPNNTFSKPSARPIPPPIPVTPSRSISERTPGSARSAAPVWSPVFELSPDIPSTNFNLPVTSNLSTSAVLAGEIRGMPWYNPDDTMDLFAPVMPSEQSKTVVTSLATHFPLATVLFAGNGTVNGLISPDPSLGDFTHSVTQTPQYSTSYLPILPVAVSRRRRKVTSQNGVKKSSATLPRKRRST